MQRRTKAQLEADRAAKSPIKAASQAAEKVINKHHQDPAVILDVIKEVLQMQKEYLDNNDVDAFRTCQTLLSWLSDYYEQLR
jgi:flagellar biosynthesis/type III secretory pathway protein FliH